jgi:hypothetical protein
MTTEIVLSRAPELQPAPLFTPTPEAAKRVLEFFYQWSGGSFLRPKSQF